MVNTLHEIAERKGFKVCYEKTEYLDTDTEYLNTDTKEKSILRRRMGL